MEGSQVFFYGLLAILAFVFLRRMLVLRSVTNYTPMEVLEKLKQNSIVLVDVRTSDERKQGAIKNSVHIPLHQVRRRAEELNKHKHKEIVCYCATGSRSAAAAIALKKLGFNVANLKGGIAEWKLSGLQ